jgi:hypothetical protein
MLGLRGYLPTEGAAEVMTFDPTLIVIVAVALLAGLGMWALDLLMDRPTRIKRPYNRRDWRE